MDIEAPDQTDWDEKLPAALSAIRTVENKTTKETPFYVAFGFESRNPGDIIQRDTVTGAQESVTEWIGRLDDLKDLHAKVRSRILREQAARQGRDQNVRFTPFQEGEKVWKKHENKRRGLARKLIGDRWRGPYVVKSRKGDTTYKIQLEGRGQRELMINHRRLKRHVPRPPHLQSPGNVEHETDSDEDASPVLQEPADDGAVVDDGWQLNDDQEQREVTPQRVNRHPRRARRPPLRLTYEAGGHQLETRNLSESSSE